MNINTVNGFSTGNLPPIFAHQLKNHTLGASTQAIKWKQEHPTSFAQYLSDAKTAEPQVAKPSTSGKVLKFLGHLAIAALLK